MAADQLTAGEALGVIRHALDDLDANRASIDARTRLQWAASARELAGRMESLAQLLLAEADQAQASLATTGTPTSSWLSLDGKLSKRESAGLLHRAKALAERPAVGEAAVAGRVGSGQARAITMLLDSWSGQLDDDQQHRAEELLVDLAARLDADQLARSATRVLQEVAPQSADELLQQRLQRESEAAQRNRSLVFSRDHQGSTLFRGSLPLAEAEAWLTLIDAHAESLRRNAVTERDPLAERLTPQQRRADALIAMIHAHSATRSAPTSGGDRPRVIVTLDYERLRAAAAGAGIIGDDEQLSAGDLRRLCCDADILPTVLGGPSEILDAGRSHRLVTSAIRAALTSRDRGCAFPGCDTRAAVCEAHHITPGWAGGSTSLSNLALLCHHHHGLVEPAKYSRRDQWEIRLGSDGTPEAIPPRRYDPQRIPIRHQRYRSPDQSAVEAPPDVETPAVRTSRFDQRGRSSSAPINDGAQRGRASGDQSERGAAPPDHPGRNSSAQSSPSSRSIEVHAGRPGRMSSAPPGH